ncbi:MAG: CDP-diacylglycerol--glycerol-3-phosphate 3-phosphatidyltransferase [Candidatus Carbobacillus altaicus]|nr:CDP-diacylglycerol--glycerol-3-phosphate 3-phosphatidyltransferase [Candidatus Carbobacillus altaicus]
MNIANQLTLLRLILIPVILSLMLGAFSLSGTAGTLGGETISVRDALASFLFVLAALTDFLDGYLARKYRLITDFGKFLDPLVDKMLVLGVLVALVELGRVGSFVVFLILLREFAVSGLRMLAAARGTVIAASGGGKIKTTLQLIAVLMLMLVPHAFPVAGVSLGTWLLYAATFLTLYSGGVYFWTHRSLFKGEL